MSDDDQNNTSEDPLRLPPPTFALPEDMEEEYELWSVRLPSQLDLSSLQNVKLKISENKGPMGTFESENQSYGLVQGHAVENESFRLLLPEDEDSDDVSDDDSSDKQKFLRPSSITFARHVNVVDTACIQEIPDVELAPRLEKAPTTVDPIRRSYTPIAQKSGLKRRWMPLGAGKPPVVPNTTTTVGKLPPANKTNGVKISESSFPDKKKEADKPTLKRPQPEAITPDTSLTTVDEDTEATPSKKKSKKEKKSEKKAKKERKREKKEKKHRKEVS